jgi:hypothetical protein
MLAADTTCHFAWAQDVAQLPLLRSGENKGRFHVDMGNGLKRVGPEVFRSQRISLHLHARPCAQPLIPEARSVTVM